MKKAAWLIVALTLVASATYVVVYLNRWEWNRAMFCLGVFLAAEVGLATALILRKLGLVHEELKRTGRDADAQVLARLEQTRPERNRFAWMRESAGRTNVFITMLMGGGVLVSGLAWVIDKVAGRTVTASQERHLARELAPIRFPTGGFVADDATLLAESLPFCDDPDLRLLVGDTSAR